MYDAAGQIAASRVGSEPWSCINHDARGRIVKKSFPAMNGQSARTVTYDYAVGGDPRKTKSSDESGSVITVIDLLGRIDTYTDANGVTTHTEYDRVGRKSSEKSTVKGVTSTLNYYWNDAFQLTRLDQDGTTVAAPGYKGDVLQSAAYGNRSNLTVTQNDAGSLAALTWKVPDSTVVGTVTRSRDQRVIDEKITDTAKPGSDYNFAYTYDGAGRLVAASMPFHRMTYAFAGDNGCGPNKKAGLNTNRTTFTDSLNGAAPATTNYCYDDADRLLSTNGATNLSLSYDSYGNTTKIGTDTLGYDSTLRHVSTATAAGRSVKYTRDVADRITARTVQENAKPAQVTQYGFTSDSGGPDFVLDSSGNLRQRVLKLPGGVVLTKSYGQNNTTNWSYPNVHGDILFTADGNGARTGAIHLYDPYGQNIDPASGVIGDIPIPATAEGGMDFGWLGQNTVPIEHIASQQALEMGARTYLPILGRFLQVDPVLGGSANNYDYVNGDPVNSFDLSGKCPFCVGLLLGGALVGGAVYLYYKGKEDGREEERQRNENAESSSNKNPTPHEKGKAGEEAVRTPKNTEHIVINGHDRIPDILDHAHKVVGEIKNVKVQSLDSQIQDDIDYADKNGYTFILFLNEGARMTGPLQEEMAKPNREVVIYKP
ncbi:putative toxin [Nocardia sp. CA-128927]|uniref:putative toxin n=1 Tax=Nocardia sp. CA-128927 TaxID=3239975 RepID=UPI003D99EDD5